MSKSCGGTFWALLLVVAVMSAMTDIATPTKEPPSPGTNPAEGDGLGPSSTSPISRRVSTLLGALPPPQEGYDYTKSTEDNYAIARVVSTAGRY